MKRLIVVLALVLLGCTPKEIPSEFSEKALNEVLYDVNGTAILFKDILENHKGKKILIDFWASWCKDCVKSMPGLVELQKNYPDVVYLFLSVDKKVSSWKRGIEVLKMQGLHYNLPKGMRSGNLVDFFDVGWIPRYVVVDENQKIILFKATKSTDSNIIEALKK